MSSTERAAQEAKADGIFNRGTPTKDPRPTAKGEGRIQKGKKFMPKWSIPETEEYMKCLKDGKERLIVLVCIKRKESKTIGKIAEEMRRPPDTVRGWLARGREKGLYDLAYHKPPGKAPALNDTMVETMRGWMSKSPHGFRPQEEAVAVQDGAAYDTQESGCGVRRRHRAPHHAPHTVLIPQVQAGPRKSASEEKQKSFKVETAALLARLAVLGYVILALGEASCLVDGTATDGCPSAAAKPYP